METNERYYSQHGMGEGNPGNIDPDEIGRPTPSKAISEIEKLKIEQSEFGRDQGQKPADEHIDHSFSQIDDDTRQIHSDSMERTLAKEFDTDDYNRVDERDNLDSTEEWDAEKSRTGRHK
jgi:hypothetical protein